jgi:hypothetical protein
MNHDEDAVIAQYNAEWNRLCVAARAEDVFGAELLVREWADAQWCRLAEVDVAFLARVMSDVSWARKHPLSALLLAWKHRRARPLRHSLPWLWRAPRFAG